jgi:hypothetical protein
MSIVSGADLTVELGKIPRERLLYARAWFAEHGSADAPPLPLSYGEREHLKRGDLGHLVALYARSLAEQGYDIERHPSFHDYACGVMASGLFDPGDEGLRRRFPARRLAGLDNGLYWSPPKRSKRSVRRSR